MSKPKLTYFGIEGRGEPARLAFAIGGVEFEDHRISFQEWGALKPKMPWGSIPVLEHNGKTLAQSNAINRYVGRLTGLYPTDAWEAGKADEAMDAVEDLANKISPTITMPDGPEKLSKRAELASGPVPFYLGGLERELTANGGKFFAGKALSVADLKVYGLLRWISSGTLDGIPASVIPAKLVAFRDSISAHPKVAAWHAAHAKK